MFTPLSLLKAKVGHTRSHIRHNSFVYDTFYVRVNIAPTLPDTPRLFSFNRFNLLSLSTNMHGAKDGSDLYTWAVAEFTKHGVALPVVHTIYLVAHPRYLGYAFNPISYWLVHNEQDELIAAMCEVRNTFKQYHNYVLSPNGGGAISPEMVFTAKKDLYVSPFNKTEGYYTFTFLSREEKFKSVINYFLDDDTLVLNTYMGGSLKPLTNRAVISAIVQYPLATLMTILRIHFQAIILWSKKIPLTLSHRSKSYIQGRTSKGQEKP